MPSASPQQLARVFDLVGPLYRQAVRNLDQAGGPAVGVRAVLDLLTVRDVLTVPRIGEVLGLSRQFVQRCVNEAQEGGLVALQPNPAHQRSSLVSLTDAGRSVIATQRAADAATLGPMAAALPTQDVEACVRVLERLLDLVRQDPGPISR